MIETEDRIQAKVKRPPKQISNLLRCNIDQVMYDFNLKVAIIHLPMQNCTDMTGVIAFCMLLDKKVKQIQVYEGGSLINVYYLHANQWQAKSLPRSIQ